MDSTNGFHRDGFLTLASVFDVEVVDIAACRANEKFSQLIRDIENSGQSFGVGVKNGFAEIVQRHPLRYEMRYGMDEPLFDFVLNNEAIRTVVSSILGCDDFIVANRSLVVSVPGCGHQSWHSDGPHMSATEDLPCHCVNVFVPLVNINMTNGPTEFRPGSQWYTRGNLAKSFLLAKAKKQIRDIETPLVPKGSILMFDYRVLHRGASNTSESIRPILVFTFAKPWYKDVLNFPKKSFYGTKVPTGSDEKYLPSSDRAD